ncbi:hypothetical protein PUMCH_000867 [Australozyma saopauloensis]|uniref:DNA-directed DNA polymerase n=1 Tax=Australozyma saopauloensis TaxID=291208 RepID=A0AAX4H7C4_9ASCO|nr:hypothetical protein PUMCH_000867 [[Candida] saopauloensis]
MNHLNKNLPSTAEAVRVESSLAETYPKDSAFLLPSKNRDYGRQFFSMYQQRLAMLKPRVDREATRKWGSNTREVNGKLIQHKQKILDIVLGELCWVSGTIFSDMKHKLNILKDVEKGTDDLMPQPSKKYVDADNEAVVMIEDESGRAILHNEELLRKSHLVTGCFVGVLGIEIQAGIFEIMEIVNPAPAPQTLALADVDSSGPEEWLAFVSGLSFGKETDLDPRTLLLLQWLSGELGGEDDVAAAKKILTLVVVGNSIVENEHEENLDFTTTNNFGSKNTSKFSPESLTLFGQWLNEIVATIPAVVMPGESDPCEVCLPQQPVHRALFSQNAPYVGSKNLVTKSNPTWMQTNAGLRILACAGQNIDDICKYRVGETSLEETLDIMEQTLRWQVFVPTAPDTLYCYPYEDSDPFTLDEMPNLYVVGNQCGGGSRTVEIGSSSVKLLSVPAFKSTGEILLVNTKTLEVKSVLIE